MKTKWNHIDTEGLPPKYDCADLIAEGKSKKEITAWMNSRIKQGPQPAAIRTVESKPEKKKEKPKVAPPPKAEVQPESNVAALRKPDESHDYDFPVEFSEDSLAQMFSDKYHDTTLFCGPWNRWMTWEGNAWKPDDSMSVIDNARKIVRSVVTDLSERTDLGNKANRIASQLSTYRTLKSMTEIAKSDRRHVIRPSDFDSDPWTLNTPDGIVDLRTGQLRPARKEDFVTKMTKVGPNNKKPKVWLEYLETATEGDKELQGYLQRIAGYCLTGSIAEHSFFFIYGDGGTGKGTFKDFLDWMLHDYAKAANIDTFTEQRFKSHSSEIAYFQGARLVTATETDEGSRWAEGRIKALTGGDPITASFKHQNEFTFQPLFKLLFTGNHKPQLRSVDAAIKRRLYLIPFEHKISDDKKDLWLPKKIRKKGEAGAILNWMIEGCLEWQETMLKPPKRVLAHTADYLESEDRIGRFLSEYTEPERASRIRTTVLYAAYKQWSQEQNEYAISRHRFLKLLEKKGYKTEKRSGEQVIMGMRQIKGWGL